MNQVPELNIIVSLFHQTLGEYTDAIWDMTDLYDEGKIPNDIILSEHVRRVSNRREKLLMCCHSARTHHGIEMQRMIPLLHLHGGIC